MIDLATIQVKAGDGGNGCVSFRREKFVAKGGPDGGDGGNGGSVYAVGDHNMATLMDFRSEKKYSAGKGLAGMGKNMKGEDGADIEISLPLGTLIYEIQKGKETLVEDIIKHGERVLLAKGGKGGIGNARFKSSTNRTPRQFTKGILGEEKELKLEIKLVADIGLVGLPNAGKSTLINRLTNSQAKVASYPFTTLSPNLGILELKNGQKAVISDIPGLIEGASVGKGLGDEFLRHVERTRILVHMIDPFSESETSDIGGVALEKYDVIQKELKDYKVDLTSKEQIVVVNKMDITEVRDAFDEIKKAFREQRGVPVLGISAVSGEGLDVLTEALTKKLSEIPKKPFTEKPTPVKMYTIDNLPNKRMVYGKNEVFELE